MWPSSAPAGVDWDPDAAPLLGSGDNDAKVQFQVVLLTNKQGDTLQSLLESKFGKEAQESDEAAAGKGLKPQGLTHNAEQGEVLFEGDQGSMQDLDRIVATVAAALGMPVDGPIADALRRQLAKALTDAEFDSTSVLAEKAERRKGVPRWAMAKGGMKWIHGLDSTEGDGDYEEDDADDDTASSAIADTLDESTSVANDAEWSDSREAHEAQVYFSDLGDGWVNAQQNERLQPQTAYSQQQQGAGATKKANSDLDEDDELAASPPSPPGL